MTKGEQQEISCSHTPTRARTQADYCNKGMFITDTQFDNLGKEIETYGIFVWYYVSWLCILFGKMI